MKLDGRRDFHEARWDEPILMEMGAPGQRAILTEAIEPQVAQAVGSPTHRLPAGYRRAQAPKLPELGQMQLLRHYLRLSQETIGADINIDIGLGTCTMKYNPKIHETFVRDPRFSELHPYQDESTTQGILKVMYETEQYLKAISGMDRFSLNPAGGSQGIFSNVAVIKAYHDARGEGAQRNEIITTILSHPGNAGTAAALGYKVITLYPDESGIPDLEALKAAVSEHTAALLITNPEDTGIYNEKIRQFVDIVHAAGGLCVYDQANLNGLRTRGLTCASSTSTRPSPPPTAARGPAPAPRGAPPNWPSSSRCPRWSLTGRSTTWTTTTRTPSASSGSSTACPPWCCGPMPTSAAWGPTGSSRSPSCPSSTTPTCSRGWRPSRESPCPGPRASAAWSRPA